MGERLPLRRAVPSDALALRALTRAAYEKWIPIINREPLPMTADYDRAIAQHIIDLWEEDSQLFALIEMIPSAGYLLIENLAVRPDQQGKGLGDSLLRHAETVAAALGFNELRLYTNAAFASNVAFYARRGYQEYQRNPIPAGGIVVYMKKLLTPAS